MEEGLQGFAGRELEGDLLVLDLLLVFIVNLGDSLFHLSPNDKRYIGSKL
jgi:hypothetical protein